MYLIAIIDDDEKEAAVLAGQVRRSMDKRNEAYILKEYRDGLDFIRIAEEYDIVFMDIRMDKLDGIETARVLRKVNRDTLLIFVTHMAQFALKGYEVEALDFIIKPTDQFSIDFMLTKALRRIENRAGVALALKTADGVVKVRSNEVYYVEIFNHDLIYHTTQGDFRVRGQLSDVARRLADHHFILCNRSYLVNLLHVTSVNSEYLTVNGVQLPVSRSHRKEIERRFINYLGANV